MLISQRLSCPAVSGAGATFERQQATAAFISRNELFAGLALVAFANGISGKVSNSVSISGIAAALVSTFDISIIVWSAWALSLVFLARGPMQSLRRSDQVVAALTLLACLVPAATLSWLALVGLAIHILRTSPRSSFMQRGASILLALTVPMFWAPLLFVALSGFILQADATLVGWLVGTHRVGNAIQLADGSGYLWIAPPCSSLANVSLAILCWITATQIVDRPGSLRDVGWVALACTAVVGINATRISLIGLHPEHYDLIHGPFGATVASWLILGVTVAICLFGVRHDLQTLAYSKSEVTFRLKPSVCLGIVLAVSLLVQPPASARATPEGAPAAAFPAEVAMLLQQQGFQVSHVTPEKDLPWVFGVAGDCRVRVTEVEPQGWQQSLMTVMAGDQQLVYLFAGASYSEQPILRTRTDYYWNRLNRYIGRSTPDHPVLAVISTPACEDLPLSRLAELSNR